MHLNVWPLSSSLPAHSFLDPNFNNLWPHWNPQFNKPTTLSLPPTPVSSLGPLSIVKSVVNHYNCSLACPSPPLNFYSGLFNSQCPQHWLYPTFPTLCQELSSWTWLEGTQTHLLVSLWISWPQTLRWALQWVLPNTLCSLVYSPSHFQVTIEHILLSQTANASICILIYFPEKNQRIQKKTSLRFH